MTLDLQPVSLETLAQFSSLIIEAAHWLEREGKTLWNPLELTPKALLERYHLDELFLDTLEGETIGTAVLQDTDPLFWPDALEGKLCTLTSSASLERTLGRDWVALCWTRLEKKRKRGAGTFCGWIPRASTYPYARFTRATVSLR